jgi:hypothetical protein
MTSTKTFTGCLTRSFLKGGAWLVILGFAFIALTVYTNGIEATNPNLTGPSYPEQVAAKHGCEKPVEGVLPSAVIVTREGDIAAKYLTSDKAIGDALDFALNGADNGIVTVYTFCR